MKKSKITKITEGNIGRIIIIDYKRRQNQFCPERPKSYIEAWLSIMIIRKIVNKEK